MGASTWAVSEGLSAEVTFKLGWKKEPALQARTAFQELGAGWLEATGQECA